MKTFYKITITIALFSLFLIFISFPEGPAARFGEYLFGDYKTYLGALLSISAFSVIAPIIGFVWKTF